MASDTKAGNGPNRALDHTRVASDTKDGNGPLTAVPGGTRRRARTVIDDGEDSKDIYDQSEKPTDFPPTGMRRKLRNRWN